MIDQSKKRLEELEELRDLEKVDYHGNGSIKED